MRPSFTLRYLRLRLLKRQEQGQIVETGKAVQSLMVPKPLGIASFLFCAVSGFAVTNITFYSISDTHYGQVSAAKDTARNQMPITLNNMPGKTYPASLGGGLVDAPRVVLIPGDLVETNDTAWWNAYTRDYGVIGERRLLFPTYEGIGNHDFYPSANNPDSLSIVKRMINRNAARRNGLTAIDTTGYHYSWDWDGVHFINLNLYGGGTESGYNGYRPLNAIAFLQQDLAARIGNSGRPVFIMQHYPLRDNTYFPSAQRTQLASALAGYNVIGILHGHSHTAAIYKWIVSGDTIDVFDDGTVMNGNLMVFQITEGRLRAVSRTNGVWSTTIQLDKTFSMGTPVGLRAAKGNGSYRNLIFSIPETGWNQQVPATVRRIEVTDLQGKRLRLLTLRFGRFEWNRKDSHGYRVQPGLYLFRDEAKGTPLGKIVLR